MRKHFGIIVWIALGQTPNLLACQRQLFAQLTGGDLPVESTPEQKLEEMATNMRSLMVMMRGMSKEIEILRKN